MNVFCCILILDVLDFVLFKGAPPYMSPGGPRPGPPGQRPQFMPPYQSPGVRQPAGSNMGPYQGMRNVPHGQTPPAVGTQSSQQGGPYPALPNSPTPYPGMTQSLHANLPPQSAQQVTGNMSCREPCTFMRMGIFSQ